MKFRNETDYTRFKLSL